MLFHTLQFLLFFAPVFFLNLFFANRVGSSRARKWVLIAASAAFYMSWSAPLFALLALSISINYVVAQGIFRDPDRAKRWVSLGITGQLVILGVFKYANFGIESAAVLLDALGLGMPRVALDIVLPLGISFYTFQGIGYCVDVYRRHYEPYDSYLDFFLYISFFPQLVAGPIVRGDFFREQLRRFHHPITLSAVTSGLTLLVTGVFKKAVLADNAGKIANLVFNDPTSVSSLIVLLGVYAFAFQIYFDFSGYTDMARGLGRMLGIELPINFNLPYLSRGLREFWQRWHISLSTWLRDYLYIPLGGSRVTEWVTYRNLMLTMLLGGLWHGASWNFVVWGGIHGVGLAIEHMTLGKGERRLSSRWSHALVVFLTFQLVCFAWIFFRADTFATSATVIAQLADFGGYLQFHELNLFRPQNWFFGLLLPALMVFAIEPRVPSNGIGLEMAAPFRQAVACCTMFFLILLTSGRSNEFIYFQF